MIQKLTFFTVLLVCQSAIAQHISKDSVRMKHHKEMIISEKTPNFLPSISGTNIYAGKKSEVIQMNQLDADLSSNNGKSSRGFDLGK